MMMMMMMTMIIYAHYVCRADICLISANAGVGAWEVSHMSRCARQTMQN